MLIYELCCKRCKEVKPLSDFDRSFFGKTGYDIYCNDCRVEINKIYNVLIEKRCRQCGRVKSVSEFGKNASTRDGYYKECLDCQDENYRRKRARRNEGIWDGSMSICRICGLQKPTYEFINQGYQRSGYVYCRSCIAEMNRKKLLKYEQQREEHGWCVEKRCKGCGQVLPSDRFHLDRRSEDGLSDKCNECYEEWYSQWMKNVKEKRHKKKIKKSMKKECQICHILKPFSSFVKNSSNKDGYSDQCRVCNKKVREENVRIWASQRKEKKVILKDMQCRICGRNLPINMFSKNKETKKGYYNYCKDCSKLRAKNVENRWAQERKKAMFEFSLDFKVEKKCKLCGQILPLSMFWKRLASKDGYGHYCKTCDSKKDKERNKRLKERGFPEELLPKEKRCSSCGRILPSSMFSRNSTANDGLSDRCKACYKEYYKEYCSRPEVRQRQRDYKKRPEVMERNRLQKKKYSKRPEVKKKRKEYEREYRKRLYVKEQRRQYDMEYSKRPEVIERRRQYDREYIKRPEIKEKRRQYWIKYYSSQEVKEKRREYDREYRTRPEVLARQRKSTHK